MSHRKHAAQREAKEALRDPDADTAARIEALLREAEQATIDAESAAVTQEQEQQQ